MEYRTLGNTGINVSRLCFGSLTIGPLQAKLSYQKGAGVIFSAIEQGINFIDTAELYNNYEHIRRAIKAVQKKIIITTKSYAYTMEMAEKSLNKALRDLGRDYIDIFMLHEQESRYTLEGHEDALNYYLKAKDNGKIRAVGVSTHTVEGVRAAADITEIEVIHPIINYQGVGIKDGTVDDMISAIEYAKQKGKGIYGMKPLGGGNLIDNVMKSFEFVLGLSCLDSIAVGMQSVDEVVINTRIFNSESIPENIFTRLLSKKRTLLIDSWCVGCGSCKEACSYGAITIVNKKASVDHEKCILCGYCGRYCKEFCIKVI